MKRKMKNRAVFLDRDGVLSASMIINGKLIAPQRLEDFQIFPEAILVTKKLKKAGFILVVVTNQPDVARGFPSEKTVEQMHEQMFSVMPLDRIEVCYHLDEHQCSCRKPKPAMLLRAAQELDIDLQQSFMVGDRWRDIEAGQNAGCKTIWLKQDIEEKKPQSPDMIVNTLEEACDWIMEEAQRNRQ